MDDIVRKAMVKWPNVPHCYGWLGLDARGNWYLRDGEAQALGGFSSGETGAKGSLLKHEKLIDFIQRNYDVDSAGQWFFQNGPQRVYVELDITPWIWRVQEDGTVRSHGGQEARVSQALVDEQGRVFLVTDLGLGLVHTQDMLHVAEAVDRGVWNPEPVMAAQLPTRFGYVLSPAAANHSTESATKPE